MGETNVQVVKRMLSVACPNCQSPAGKWCTRPTSTTRVVIAWFHLAREAAAREQGR